MKLNQQQRSVAAYYSRPGSRLGFRFVMRRSQHFGLYDANHTDEWSAQNNFHEQFTRLLDARAGQKILDAGCGQGVVAAYVAQRKGTHVTGVTITPYEVASARNVAARQGVSSRTDFMQADYSAMPFPDCSFDRIYAIETLCHAVDIQQVITEFGRVLKPGGRVVLAEYEVDYARFNAEEKLAADILLHDAGCFGVYQLGPGQFPRSFHNAGFEQVNVAADWTAAVKPSVERLERLSRPFTAVAVRLIHTRFRRLLTNVLIAKMYGESLRRGEFRYKVFTAAKPVQ